MRWEQHLDRLPRLYGNGFLAYLTDSLTYDNSLVFSFTYSYAARLWTYLKIDIAGLYTFYFNTASGLKCRLWVEDQLYFTSRQHADIFTEEKSPSIHLNVGYRKLRLDYIQRSPGWDKEGSAIIVLYEGPAISKQMIPHNKLYSVILNDGQPTAAAENWKFLQDPKSASLPCHLALYLWNIKTV